MAAGLTLVCPVRGRLKAKARSADGLTPSEERLRVELIRHLIERGYDKANIRVEAVIKRFGNSGRNSFRVDVAVLDVPVSTLPRDDVDELLRHAVILGEVKRDNSKAASAKAYQVKPMLDFAGRDDCVAVYWDDVERRVYWQTHERGRKVSHEGPLSDLPAPGHAPGAVPLTFATISADKPLLTIFRRIENILHSASIGQSKRFNILLQLLLAKLHDEHLHSTSPDTPLILQDFQSLGTSATTAAQSSNKLLKQAVQYYKAFLPEPVADKFPIPGDLLLEVMQILAPIKIVSMKQSVIQDFYMYFARHIYKWDLAQYFTPTTVTDFIVEVLNPRFGEHIRDPACGSADFLTAAFRRGQAWPDYASSVWGSDVSGEAVQVAVLNMILNGDGKTNIHKEDSLQKIVANQESCDIVICNPPFGTSITERRTEVLNNFDLGHEWLLDEQGQWQVTDKLLGKQEVGILFAETCTRLVHPGGRFALIVPNGYLGNRSQRYLVLREWLLRHCRPAVVVGLPRFAFKSSGASVAASIIFCEKREEPLANASEADDYELCVEIVDRVGWKLGDKRGETLYRRDPSDGTYLYDEADELILDSDFADTLSRIRASDAAEYFPWLTRELPPEAVGKKPGWTVQSTEVAHDEFCTLDPKRHSRKLREVQNAIVSNPYFRLGDVVDFMVEGSSVDGERRTLVADKLYRYVEINDVSIGTYRWQSLRGWEVPSRGKHHAEPDDIYIGSIWSCVRKWFLAARDCDDMVVTNGFLRLRLKPDHNDLLLDIVAGLCSEAFGTQMRSFARGSDGLAEISSLDAAEVVLPYVKDPVVREELKPFVDQLRSGYTSVEAKVTALLDEGRLPIPRPPDRPHHTSVV
ncbi:class I SAM-dependent DNA methyltransferase [Actinomadura sp. 9N215]|uniref:class I SAM-dependent DNA methyltransferase n=1 Tax=Actinomadura sp. 9N215 TaxID=3375150 RepID=UPI0037A755FB